MDSTLFLRASIDPAVFMGEVMGLQVKPYHREWLDLLVKHDRIVITAARGHGKSSTFAVVFPLWICAFQKNKEVLIVSNTVDQSKDILKKIKNEILSNEYLSVLVPRESNKVWSKTEIDLESGCTIKVRPNTENIRGGHADYVIVDEVSYFEDKDTFFSAISQAIQPDAKIAAIGTPRTDQDLLADLMHNPRYVHRTYPALNEKGEALWEERYSKKRLEEIKTEIGSLRFEREYMCKKIPVETQLLSREALEPAFASKAKLGGSSNPDGIYYIGCDLAISQKKSADFTVYTVIEQVENGCIIREIHKMKGAHITAQKMLLRRLSEKYRPRQIILDQSTFGEAMVQELRGEGFPVRGYSFDANSRMDLLNNMISLLESHKILIPRDKGSGRTIQLTDQLIHELTSLGTATTNSGQLTYKSFGPHPDMSMSLGLAVKPLRFLRKTGKAVEIVTDSSDSNTQDNGIIVVSDNQNPSDRQSFGMISTG